MSEEGMQARWEQIAHTPYQPLTTSAVDERVAFALDYIAAQLGQINVKLDRMIAAAKR
jgi:hypothetical protein